MNLRPNRRDPPDINLTPLIDVVFLLLIFFMVSTTFKEDGRIKIQLPQAQGEPIPAQEPQLLEIAIDGAGTVYINQRQVLDRRLKTLKKAIAKAAGEDPEIPVLIKADANSPHQAVMSALDAASQLGLVRFSFAATRPDPSP